MLIRFPVGGSQQSAPFVASLSSGMWMVCSVSQVWKGQYHLAWLCMQALEDVCAPEACAIGSVEDAELIDLQESARLRCGASHFEFLA